MAGPTVAGRPMLDPILLTGISGFIAKHIALRALDRGLTVRGTLRTPSRADEVRAALAPHLSDPSGLDRLRFVTADLEQDQGWSTAADGVGAVIHTASPFPIAQPKDPGTLICPALEGTARVLTAAHAAGVQRVVLTSSVVAILDDARHGLQTEDDWCDPEGPTATPYARSKTLAERKAWALAADLGLAVTTINPALVLGPPLDGHIGSSLALIQRLLSGRDPMVPAMGLPLVDVRDVAEMHLRALERPETSGRRYIASAGSMRMIDMARALRGAWPDRRIARHEAPNLLMRAIALADPQVRAILPKLGRVETVSNTRAVQDMDMAFIPPRHALLDSAEWLIAHGRVRA